MDNFAEAVIQSYHARIMDLEIHLNAVMKTFKIGNCL